MAYAAYFQWVKPRPQASQQIAVHVDSTSARVQQPVSHKSLFVNYTSAPQLVGVDEFSLVASQFLPRSLPETTLGSARSSRYSRNFTSRSFSYFDKQIVCNSVAGTFQTGDAHQRRKRAGGARRNHQSQRTRRVQANVERSSRQRHLRTCGSGHAQGSLKGRSPIA